MKSSSLVSSIIGITVLSGVVIAFFLFGGSSSNDGNTTTDSVVSDDELIPNSNELAPTTPESERESVSSVLPGDTVEKDGREGRDGEVEHEKTRSQVEMMAATFLTDTPDLIGLMHSISELAYSATFLPEDESNIPGSINTKKGRIVFQGEELEGHYFDHGDKYQVIIDTAPNTTADERAKHRSMILQFDKSLTRMRLNVQYTPSSNNVDAGYKFISGYSVSSRDKTTVELVPREAELKSGESGLGWYDLAREDLATTAPSPIFLCESWQRAFSDHVK